MHIKCLSFIIFFCVLFCSCTNKKTEMNELNPTDGYAEEMYNRNSIFENTQINGIYNYLYRMDSSTAVNNFMRYAANSNNPAQFAQVLATIQQGSRP